MPGPCNSKRRKKAGKKRHVSMGLPEFNSPIVDLPPVPRPESSIPSPPSSSFPIEELVDDVLSREPAIYDPGNGPRVKNIHAFLASSFSSPPSTDDDLCAEFAQEEVLDMLYTVLPHELALCLWYNKSRKVSRICPACRRLYRLGDVLSNPLQQLQDTRNHPRLFVEQDISGLCSPVCFILASINYPEAIRLIYGKMAEEMEAVTWDFLNTRGDGRDNEGLSMLLRMTRLHDLGLAQLCLPGIQFEND